MIGMEAQRIIYKKAGKSTCRNYSSTASRLSQDNSGVEQPKPEEASQ